MDNVVIPPGTSVVVETDRHHGHRGHDGHHDRDWPERTAERVKDALAGFERAVAASQAEAIEAITTQGNANQVAIEKTGAASVLATNTASQQVQNMFLEQFNVLSTQTQTQTAAISLAVEKTAAAGLLEAAKNAAAAAKTACENQMAVLLQFKDAQLFAAQNQAAVLAAQAECCCELKERIHAEGERTRSLIEKNEIDELRAKLAAIPRGIAVTIPPGVL